MPSPGAPAALLLIALAAAALSGALAGPSRVDCKKFVFAPLCRGVASKRQMLPPTDTSRLALVEQILATGTATDPELAPDSDTIPAPARRSAAAAAAEGAWEQPAAQWPPQQALYQILSAGAIPALSSPGNYDY